jgi:protein-S-isoprenylcysteine O-methyltransferase Ste14
MTVKQSVIGKFVGKNRINLLRVFFVFITPVLLFSKSVWDDSGWISETVDMLGIFLIITAVLGRFWAIIYIGGRKSELVFQDGPYSIARHPLYLFSTIGALGFGVMMGSIVLTIILAGVTFIILNATAEKEEHFLRATYGNDYDEYAARVPRIIPKLSLFKTEKTSTFSVGELRNNMFDALVFLGFIPLAEALEIVKKLELIPTFSIY